MGIADDMRGLREDIIASHDNRVRVIGKLVGDTHRMLKGFEADRKKMSREQAKTLADFVKDLKSDVANMIGGFQKEHEEMADNLRERLQRGEADRLKNFKDMMGNIQKCVKDVENYVANKLKEFHDTHADMSEKLKKELAKYVAGIVSESGKLLKGYAKEREEMAANWRGVTATKKRVIKPEAKPLEEEAGPLEDLEERVLKFIERHPVGVKVGDMEQSLGVPRTRLGVIAKKLLEEAKVRKEENLYFPL